MTQEIILRDDRQRRHAIDLITKLDPKKLWVVIVKRYVQRRSNSQNNLYHLWIGIIADHTGHDHDEICEIVKGKFLKPIIVDVDGDLIEIRPSTTKLSTAEFTDYLEKISAWAATMLGISLPYPEDLANRQRAA